MIAFLAALAIIAAADQDPAPSAPARAIPLSPPPAVMTAPAGETRPSWPNDPDLQAVEGNRALVKTKAASSGGYPELPDALREQGHHGQVYVVGLLGSDGKLAAARLSYSSGSPQLDALALSAVNGWTWSPARDADGKPLAIPLQVKIEFAAYKSSAPGGGLVRYGCRQFVLDQDWWRSTHPGARRGDHELYVLMLGVNTIMNGGLGAGGAAGFKARVADFERRWDASIEKCRKAPDKRFIDMLQPEGKAAEALSRSAR